MVRVRVRVEVRPREAGLTCLHSLLQRSEALLMINLQTGLESVLS